MSEPPSPDVLHDLTLGDVVREHRRRYPDHTAVVDGAVRLTYPELDDRVNRLANGLHDAGVGAGDRLVWLGQNSHRLLELLLAAAKTGAVCCPVNWRQTADELAFVLDDAAPALVVWQEQEIGDAVAEAREASSTEARWVDSGDEAESLLADDATDDERPVDPRSPVLQIYTGAFGGRPNGAQLGHESLIAQALVMAMVNDVDDDYRWLNSGPMFHIGTLMFTMATLVMGGTNVFIPRMDAEELCRVVEAERCTGAFVMGASVDQILEVNADGRYDLSSLRGVDRRLLADDRPDPTPWDRRPGGYGQTEVNGMLTLSALGPTGAGAHGRPGPLAQVRILDPDGDELPVGETGEICARGPAVMAGYHDRAEVNEHRQRGGWWHTGDLGRREADGTVTFIGPATRMIKSAAENIYPAEVETCLDAHPAVRESAIIGVPDDRWVQSVKAVVALQDGETATADDLIEHCRERIASYKKPRSVEFVDALPRDGWAIDYDALDERFGGGNYPGGDTPSS